MTSFLTTTLGLRRERGRGGAERRGREGARSSTSRQLQGSKEMMVGRVRHYWEGEQGPV